MTRAELLSASARGMSFSTGMVQALPPAGIKNRTMRLVKGKRDKDHGGGPSRTRMFSDIRQISGFWYGVGRDGLPFINDPIKPRHKVGDIVYVRETFAWISDWTCVDEAVGAMDGPIYRADWNCEVAPRWRPSIHMPKTAARTFIRITGVRAQRPQELTVEEIRAEGIVVLPCTVQANLCGHCGNYSVVVGCRRTEKAHQKWIRLWDSLCDKKELPIYGYQANPWCWVYEFEVIPYD